MLFVMDPIEKVNIHKDTTFAFLEAAQARGHENFVCDSKDLFAIGSEGFAWATPVRVQRKLGAHVEKGAPERLELGGFDRIWMRKDPPFDMNYLYATHLLERVKGPNTRVINRPAGLRSANEKSFILNFPAHTPESLVTRRSDEIRRFCEEHGRAVIKPLDLMGGAGIFMLSTEDPNFGSIIEQSTKYGEEFVMVQRFVPEARQGDKRIVLIGDEVLGAILRVPTGVDFRGNMAAGGQAIACEITTAEQEIIEDVLPLLRENGLWFVGLDIIGGRLTEVNVTSPTGIQEIAKFNGTDPATRVIEWAELGNF